MSPKSDSTLDDLKRKIADLQHELAKRTAERDDAQREMRERTTGRDPAMEQQASTAPSFQVVNDSLKANEARYSLVTQAMAEGIYDWDISANTLWVSPRLIEIFGLTDNSLSAADWNERVHPEDFEHYRTQLRDCFKGITTRLACEYRIRFTAGHYRWVEDNGLPVRNESGRVLRLVGAVSDITERKEADQALLETNHLRDALLSDLNAVTDTVDYAVLFMGPDLRGRVINRAFREMWGIPDAFIATSPTMADLINYNRHNGLYDVPEAEFDVFVARRVEAIQAGSIAPVEMHRADGRILRYEGVVLPDGGRMLTYFDITASKHREGELREALDQQTATAEVLQVINSSPGDLTPVFDAMLERAMRLCGIAVASLHLHDGGKFLAVAMRGVPDALAELLRQPYEPSVGAPALRLLAGEQFVQIADMAASARDRPQSERAQITAEQGLHTALFVPLRKDTKLLGHIAAYRREVQPYTEKQIGLLQNFAAQAVIAMENARLITETREALEQQTATAEVLGVINSSPGDLAPVFDTMLEKAMRLCEAAFGVLWMFDNARLVPTGWRGVPGGFADFLSEMAMVPGPGTAAYRFMQGERSVIQNLNMKDEEPYRAGDPIRRSLVDLGGARSALHVPLIKEDVVLGIITIYRQEIRPFTDKQIALLQNFAAQAVVAMENARLITETRERTTELQEALEYQTATSDVLKVISSSTFDLRPVFETIVKTAARLCNADTANIANREAEGVRIAATFAASSEFDAFFRGRLLVVDRASVVGRTALAGQVVHVADIASDPEYSLPEAVTLGKYRTTLGVPLLREGIVIGVITLARARVQPFTERQIELVRTFADQAVIAIENARLLEEIRQRQAELRVTFDNMADGVAMFDQELRLAAWNRNFQELLDLPDKLLAERPEFDKYISYLTGRGEFGNTSPETEIARLRSRLDDHYNFERTRPDGTVIEVRNNPMPDGGVVLIYSDITERKRSEAEIRSARDAAEAAYADLKTAQASLIQAEKMASLGQLTAGIAHEIKNPLNFVNNFASLSVELLDELKEATGPAVAALDDDKRAEVDETMVMLTGNLEKIAEHGKRADNIVKSMLEHSRGVSGERREVDLNGVIEEALNLAYHGARAQDQSFNITLERDYEGSLKPIELAPQEMTRVFLNLFGNGFYAANERARDNGDGSFRPVLSVKTREDSDAVEIRVRDNGTGIPPEIKDRLFQPFFTTKPTGEGTGLGLSISYDIVTQQHGGTITVESEPGAYTEFTVRLPRH